MFFNDMDEVEVDVSVNDLEGRAARGLENTRRGFYQARKQFYSHRVGGAYYNSMHLAYGPKTATAVAEQAEKHFAWFLANAMLTEDGQTTNPSLPIDKMVNRELRRIRGAIIVFTARFFYDLEEELSINPEDWTADVLQFYLGRFPQRYDEGLASDIDSVIPGKKLPRRRLWETKLYCDKMAKDFAAMAYRGEHTTKQLLSIMEKQLAEYILYDLPYTNAVLELKEEPTPTIGKQEVAEETKILH